MTGRTLSLPKTRAMRKKQPFGLNRPNKSSVKIAAIGIASALGLGATSSASPPPDLEFSIKNRRERHEASAPTLKLSSEMEEIIARHRSHSSHRSHRSHYSGRGGSTYSPSSTTKTYRSNPSYRSTTPSYSPAPRTNYKPRHDYHGHGQMKHYTGHSVHVHPKDSLASEEFDYPKHIPYQVKVFKLTDAGRSETDFAASPLEGGESLHFRIGHNLKIIDENGKILSPSDLSRGQVFVVAYSPVSGARGNKAQKLIALTNPQSYIRTHTDFGLNFMHPSHWKAEEGSTHDFDYVRLQVPNLSSYAHPEVVFTRTDTTHDSISSLDSLRSHWESLGIFGEFKPAYRRFETKSKEEAIEATFERYVNGYTVHSTLIGFIRDGDLYQVRYDAINEDHKTTWEQFKNILATLELDHPD